MIKNIIIVGGGSAGWMTATTLLSQFPDKKITLVESPNISNIGVGESTVAGNQSGFYGIGDWLRLVNVDERVFMSHTDAIFKLSIAFENWYREDSGTFHYPFGMPSSIPKIELNSWHVKKILYPETPVSDYVECFYSAMALVNQNKSLFRPSNIPLTVKDYSFQFDATKFGLWLRDNQCKTKYSDNFTHILAEVKDISLNEDGIEHLILDDGRKLNADLFIDCTGFKSLLLTKTFNIPFESIENIIPNNYAWATKIPYKDPETQIVNYTKCTAIKNGWIWEIPLWSRMGSGYVFSDKFISSEEALKEFKQGLIKKGYENVEDLEYHLIPMRCGIQSKLWVKNTCAIGLAAGFIEPLQSNGLHSIHEFLFILTRILARGHISQWDKDEFTAECHHIFYLLAGLVAFSYALSHRDDSEYWREIQNREWPSLLSLEASAEIFHRAYVQKYRYNHFVPGSAIDCMAIGMNWNPIDIHTLKYKNAVSDMSTIKEKFKDDIRQLEERKKKWNKQVKDFPSPYQFLKDYIHT